MEADDKVVIQLKNFNKVIHQSNAPTQLATFLDYHSALDIVDKIILAFAAGKQVYLDFNGAAFTQNVLSSGSGFKKIIDLLYSIYSQEYVDQNLIIRADPKDTYLYRYIFFSQYQ